MTRRTLVGSLVAAPLAISGARASCDAARRHVQILYDASKSYQPISAMSLTQNRSRNMGRIRQIIMSLDEEDNCSFIPITGQMRSQSCEEIEMEDVPSYENELRPESMSCVEPSWLGRPFLRNRRNQRLVEIENVLGWCEQTDLKGAMFYAARILRFKPATTNYVLVFSDLHDQPLDKSDRGLCGPALVQGTKVIVVNFAPRLSDLTEGRLPSADERIARFNALLVRLGARRAEIDTPENRVLCRFGIEPQSSD
jgi:hypothetical protein